MRINGESKIVKPRPRRWQAQREADAWGDLLALPILGAAWVVKWVWRKVIKKRRVKN